MIFAIRRAERYSPNSVAKDAAILQCVSQELRGEGFDVRIVAEEAAIPDVGATAYISMGRETSTLQRLALEQARGRVVINTPQSVALCCNRRKLTEILQQGGVQVPPSEGIYGYWLKRADGVAESHDDVRFARNREEALCIREEMERKGMKDVMVQAHVPGDLVKFYGVRSTTFFRTFYPGDDGQTKFGDERLNGHPCHYLFNTDALHQTAERAAQLAGVDVYGGDCIVQPDGSYRIVDFNDWPSFSRCRGEAAHAIALRITERLRQQNHDHRKRKDAKH